MADRWKPVRRPTKADLQQKAIMDCVAKAVVAAMKPMVDDEPCKLVKSFVRADIDKISFEAIAAYIDARHDAELAEELNDDISDVGVWA